MTKKSKARSKASGKTKLSTRVREIGTLKFEPVKNEIDLKTFSDMMEEARVQGWLALGVLGKTKEDLVKAWQKEPELFAKLADSISFRMDRLRALADDMQSAHTRLLSSCAASLN